MLELEKHLENPMDPERVRFLEGSDLKPADLHVKLEEVGGANMRDGACVHQVAYGLCAFVFVLQGSAFCMFACALQLEVRLAGKEESLLEKDLIFEQVTRLCDRVKNKAESGKTDTLNLAKDVSFCL